MQVTTIVGARPQFIKAAMVSRAFRHHHPAVREVLIHTGQHYDANMSDVFFDELDIPRPDYQLGIGGGTHGQNTGRMIEAIEGVLQQACPDWVLVYGDTDSTLAAALAAVKLQIPIAHVEAGLRSFNRRMPEEINRILTDHAADLLFSPTDTATRNLANEGIGGIKVQQVGDVMYDAARYYGAQGEQDNHLLARLGVAPQGYVLATLHRAENTDDPGRLAHILAGLGASSLPVIWPIHPRTRKRLHDYGHAVPRALRLIDPLGYLDMVMLERHAAVIATDSGGVQKEAYFHRVPCLTLRDETEWVELIAAGANRLVGSQPERIAAGIAAFGGADVTAWGALYGDGTAAQRIARIMATGILATGIRA